MILNATYRYIRICTYLPNKIIVLYYVYFDDGSKRTTVGANSLCIALTQVTIDTCSENIEIISYCETSDRKRNKYTHWLFPCPNIIFLITFSYSFIENCHVKIRN